MCPTRKGNRRRPEITASGVKVKKEDRFDPWNRPQNQPDDVQKRRMLKEAFRAVLLVIMTNHTYEFDKVIRKQTKGGPIGMDLTGTIAKIYMKWWDRQLLAKFEELGIRVKLYKRYIDDMTICLKVLVLGMKFVEGKLEYNQEKEDEDKDLPEDKRTFKLLQEIGNSIHPSIQLEIDVASNHEDKKVPILDLKMWIADIDRTDGTGKIKKILYQHYIKDIANKYVIHREAAMSIANKRSILTQMCLRVLLNCSDDIGKEEKAKHVQFFMKRMQALGYDEEFRYEVLKSACEAYESICNNPDQPKYRSREWYTPERRKELMTKKKTWYRKGDDEAIMFVPATPRSELKKMVQEEVAESDYKIKVVEQPGTKVKRLLQRNDPFKGKICGDEKCFVCTTTGSGGCRKTGVTYLVRCKGDCGRFEYKGETHQNTYTRGNKHLGDFRNGVESSALWKHTVKKHNGDCDGVEFEMEIIDFIRNDATLRQVTEAIRIEETPADKRMNDQTEWNVGRLPRIGLT